MTHPRLIAIRRRVARIRRLVAACAIAGFLALFSTIYVQMASGNDPVLAAASASAAATGSSGTDSSSPTAGGSSGADSEPEAVTTAQS